MVRGLVEDLACTGLVPALRKVWDLSYDIPKIQYRMMTSCNIILTEFHV